MLEPRLATGLAQHTPGLLAESKILDLPKALGLKTRKNFLNGLRLLVSASS